MEDYTKGICEAKAVKIGGIDQWISIRGEDISAPVMLVLHGGPGSTLMGLSHAYQRPWEKYYIVVNWDQRCSGRTASISGSEPEEEITFDRMLQDSVEMVDYLREHFSRKKIIVLGHSWGTILGAALAMQYPEKLICYISTGTVVNCRREYQAMFDQLEKTYAARKDAKALAHLKQLLPGLEKENASWDWILDINNLIIKEGYSSVRAKDLFSSLKYEFLPLLKSPEYRLKDALHLTAYKAYIPLNEKFMFNYDLEKLPNHYEIPVYYINGDTDYQTPYPVGREYALKTEAPDTAFYTLKNCAHCWDVDAPEQMTEILCEKIYPKIQPLLQDEEK